MWNATPLGSLMVAGATFAALLAGAGFLHLVPKLLAPGRWLGRCLERAPLLDVVITYFLILPLVAGPVYAGWWGLLGAIVGQVAGVLAWVFIHEWIHREACQGPRIIKVLNKKVGAFRNHAALWLTAVVLPFFWVIRMAEIFIYPLLTLLVRLPAYKQSEWVNVSRHKFKGLVGHDLIWCLYCDWMTGVWSLGSEMLRNVESFWCPIRFASDKKCERCRLDFPDVDGGWVPATGTMAEVAEVVETRHQEHHGWFGHPTRLTIEGRSPESESPEPHTDDEPEDRKD